MDKGKGKHNISYAPLCSSMECVWWWKSGVATTQFNGQGEGNTLSYAPLCSSTESMRWWRSEVDYSVQWTRGKGNTLSYAPLAVAQRVYGGGDTSIVTTQNYLLIVAPQSNYQYVVMKTDKYNTKIQ